MSETMVDRHTVDGWRRLVRSLEERVRQLEAGKGESVADVEAYWKGFADARSQALQILHRTVTLVAVPPEEDGGKWGNLPRPAEEALAEVIQKVQTLGSPGQESYRQTNSGMPGE